MFRWVSTTPLGSPVLPLVNSSPASRSPPSFGTPANRTSQPAGNTTASRDQKTAAFFSSLSQTARSSFRSVRGKCSFTFSSITLAVITAFRPACRTADSAAARPEVKLRFTGVLPASTQARLAIAPPAPGGSRIPTRPSGTSRFSLRARARPAPSNTPARILLPPMPASTSTGRVEPRAKPRTQARPRESRSGFTPWGLFEEIL